MKTSAFMSLKWREHDGNPIIEPPFPSPIIADPSFLTPAESPDGAWHLFAHSLMGIHHFTSTDGKTFTRLPGLVCSSAMRPFILHDGGKYYLYYERTRKHILWFSWLPVRWKSHIECRVSDDLKTWSDPVVILRPTLAWHRDAKFGQSVSNPCVVRHGKRYLLYYSASLVYIPDCGFNEPLHIGVAEGESPAGPFVPRPGPLISPSSLNPWCNLGAGAFKVVRLDDGFVGFENGIYWNDATAHSGSAILVLTSKDGFKWKEAAAEPLVRPEGGGWKKSHVYALDARAIDERTWHLYYNARNDWHWSRGRERIGLLIGSVPGKKT